MMLRLLRLRLCRLRVLLTVVASIVVLDVGILSMNISMMEVWIVTDKRATEKLEEGGQKQLPSYQAFAMNAYIISAELCIQLSQVRAGVYRYVKLRTHGFLHGSITLDRNA